MSFVTLLEAKAHLRILDDSHDDYITTLVDAATVQAEEITSRSFLESTNEFYLSDYVGNFELPKSPLIAVDEIGYIPYGKSDYVVLSNTLYEVDDVSEPPRVRFFEGLHVADLYKAIKVTYRSGYSNADAVPKPIKQWILIRVATMFENREEIVVGVSVNKIENDYNDFLISKYRVGRL
ncbi:MAG: phage head-tail connector protein [Sulfurimonas sp.]|nr:phage head-tail connector protein [Sulfurimonas sp.]